MQFYAVSYKVFGFYKFFMCTDYGMYWPILLVLFASTVGRVGCNKKTNGRTLAAVGRPWPLRTSSMALTSRVGATKPHSIAA